MEKHGQYVYTKAFSEIHPRVIEIIAKNGGAFLENTFISATWIKNFMGEGKLFTVITRDNIIDNSNGPFFQMGIKTISTVSNLADVEITNTGGKKYKLYPSAIVNKEIRSLIVYDINTAQATPAASAAPQSASGADELVKFKKLLDDGVLTQEEFDKKKAQILGV